MSIRIRAYPYPFEAALTISTDIDTSDYRMFFDVMKYFNGDDPVCGVDGLGLELSSTFWFFGIRSTRGPDCDVAFFDMPSAPGAALVRRPQADILAGLIHDQVLDQVHSWGNFRHGGFARWMAEALQPFWREQGLNVPSWVCHGGKENVQNLLTDRWHGDDPFSAQHHTDLMRDLGVDFIVLPKMGSRFCQDHPLQLTRLRDGQLVWGVERYARDATPENRAALIAEIQSLGLPHLRNAIGEGANPAITVWHNPLLYIQLNQSNLESLIKQRGVAICAQHLTWRDTQALLLRQENVDALRTLRSLAERTILVAAYSRLLRYLEVRDNLSFQSSVAEGRITLTLSFNGNPVRARTLTEDLLEGICFCIPAGYEANCLLDGEPSGKFQTLGREGDTVVVGFPWKNRAAAFNDALVRAEARVFDLKG